MTILTWILAGFYALSGIVMIIVPTQWYEMTPGVVGTGPFNHHFVIDIGIAFFLSGAMIAWSAMDGGWRLAVAGALFPSLHGLFHVVETFSGHPPTSPAGEPIPPGACCSARDAEVRPVVVSLRDLEIGKPARIVFMAQEFHKRVDRLGSYGVVPGSVVRLRQKRPSYVLEVDGTSLALDPDVAREIYVRREN